jgi:hypothetical protein
VALGLTVKYLRFPSSIDSGAACFENMGNLAKFFSSFCGRYLILALTVGSVIGGFSLFDGPQLPAS